jgi:hypothetical protein
MVQCAMFLKTLRVELRVVRRFVYKRPKMNILLTEKITTFKYFYKMN